MSNQFDERAKRQSLQVGITIAALRNLRRISQETLAEKAGISTVELSLIESAGVHKVFSMEVFYNISRALDVEPAVLLEGISDLTKGGA